MKIYVDIVFIFNFAINFSFLFFIEKIFKDRISFKRIIIASLIGSSMIICYLFNYLVLTIFKISGGILICFIAFRNIQISKQIIKTSVFYLQNLSLVGLLESYKINTPIMLFFSVALILIIIFFENFKKYYIFIASHKYNVIIKSKKIYRLQGFLDTGNMATSSLGVPIVFISENIELDKSAKDEVILIDSICGRKEFIGHFCDDFYIKINRKWVRKKVFIVINKTEHECLLNNLLFI